LWGKPEAINRLIDSSIGPGLIENRYQKIDCLTRFQTSAARAGLVWGVGQEGVLVRGSIGHLLISPRLRKGFLVQHGWQRRYPFSRLKVFCCEHPSVGAEAQNVPKSTKKTPKSVPNPNAKSFKNRLVPSKVERKIVHPPN